MRLLERDAGCKTGETTSRFLDDRFTPGVDGNEKSVIIPLLPAPRVLALFKN